jgi:hypothetical protein
MVQRARVVAGTDQLEVAAVDPATIAVDDLADGLLVEEGLEAGVHGSRR